MLIFFAAVFFALLLLCLLTGTAVTWALLGGLILFWVYGKLRGFTHKQLWSMARKELKKGLIPWSVACSVPLAMLGADMRSLPYAALLWLTPPVYGLTKKLFYPGRKTA